MSQSQEIIYNQSTETETETVEEKILRKMGIQKNRACRKYHIGPYFSEQA